MKASKVGHVSNQSEEDCGVWLDTVQMKGNAKKKRSARPISKLLNPLANGAGYNVAVALNFTQTKIEMPKTKQSSISNFFTCQRRVLNKMATTGESNKRAQEACFPSAASPSESAAENVCYYNDYQGITEPEPVMWWDKEDEENLASSQNINSDFKEESPVAESHLMEVFENALPSSNCGKHELKIQSQKDSELNLLSISSQNEFSAFGESLFNAEGRTSTQKAPKRLPLQSNKENTIPNSPKKTTIPGSQLPSFSKNTKQEPLNNLNKESNSPIKWAQPKSSPSKKQNWQSFRDNDDESFSMLFTQDSQGFRVIAHRDLQTRSPFKDQSNVSCTLIPSEIKCLEEDDEEDMLFTQDSQGNMVIKH